MEDHDPEEPSTGSAVTNSAGDVDGDLVLSRRHTDPLLPSRLRFDPRLATNASSTPLTLDVSPTVNGWFGGSEIFDEDPHKQWAVSVGGSSSGGVGGGDNSNYTSLRDLLPGFTAQSSTFHKSGDIPIRNPLVKQAAYAYLQPKASPGPAPPRRCWLSGGRRDARDEDGGVSLFFGCVQCFSHLFDGLFAMLGQETPGRRNWMNGRQ